MLLLLAALLPRARRWLPRPSAVSRPALDKRPRLAPSVAPDAAPARLHARHRFACGRCPPHVGARHVLAVSAPPSLAMAPQHVLAVSAPSSFAWRPDTFSPCRRRSGSRFGAPTSSSPCRRRLRLLGAPTRSRRAVAVPVRFGAPTRSHRAGAVFVRLAPRHVLAVPAPSSFASAPRHVLAVPAPSSSSYTATPQLLLLAVPRRRYLLFTLIDARHPTRTCSASRAPCPTRRSTRTCRMLFFVLIAHFLMQ